MRHFLNSDDGAETAEVAIVAGIVVAVAIVCVVAIGSWAMRELAIAKAEILNERPVTTTTTR